ncbi:MAG: hypothetical protein SFY96_11375 [Planctomycetota bacterium]|nr:hypothetical protein [Planctomycetota bacterium]
MAHTHNEPASISPPAASGPSLGPTLGHGSLLDGIEAPSVSDANQSAAARERAAQRAAARAASAQARREKWNAFASSRGFKLGVAIAAGVLLVGGGIAAWTYIHREPPDYDTALLNDVFDYTLLQDDFNNLPVEKRLELIGKLVKRLQSMSGSDSALLAAFAAGIAGSARDQIEKNASRVMLDMTDKYAIEYEKLEGEAKQEYLDKAMVEMFRTMDALDGTPGKKSDEQILADAKRDSQRMKDMSGKLDNEQKGARSERMFNFMRNGIGGHSSPAQRARLTGFMRDMGRSLRGETGSK